MSFLESPAKARTNEQREKNWNDNKRLLREIAQPRRHDRMSEDIKKFVFRSVEGDPNMAEKEELIKSRKLAMTDTFNRISSTFNFTHHEGTDSKLELKIIKIILIREGQLMNLQHLSEKAAEHVVVDQSCLRVLEALSDIRKSTLNYLEALCLWRQAIPFGDQMSPRAFFWEKNNYTLRIVNDLDFLADNSTIIQALGIPPEQLRNNPLMLTNNLNDPSTWMDPYERASIDSGGVKAGEEYENRLRLRFAERILLQEIELNPTEPAEIESPTPQKRNSAGTCNFFCWQLLCLFRQLRFLL
jgi:hypothetical protein